MTQLEMRRAKAELHSLIIDKVFSYSVDAKENAEMFQYVIESVSREIFECVKELAEQTKER